MLQFRGSVVTSDAGLLAYRELDNALDLTATAEGLLADSCTGKNGRHALVGLLRQSIFGRLAGYEDVNDAQRLRHDPAICWIVGGKQQKAVQRHRVRWGDSKRAGSRNRRIYHRRAREQRMERTLRLHLLPSIVPVQSIWRSRTVRASTWQRSQCRWVGGCSQACRREARAQSSGRGFHAAHSMPTPCAFNFTRWRIISATSYARWPPPRRSRSGRSRACGKS
jgi:Transposase DDE domain group 1